MAQPNENHCFADGQLVQLSKSEILYTMLESKNATTAQDGAITI